MNKFITVVCVTLQILYVYLHYVVLYINIYGQKIRHNFGNAGGGGGKYPSGIFSKGNFSFLATDFKRGE